MMYHRPSIVLSIQITLCSLLTLGIQSFNPATAQNSTPTILYLAQTPPDGPQPLNPLELLNAYDTHMRAGYAAAKEKNYQQALESFQKALEERPNDIYAQQAIQNMEIYLSRDSFGGRRLPPWLIPGGLGLTGAILAGLLLLPRLKFPKKVRKPFSKFTNKQAKKPVFVENNLDEPFNTRFSPEDIGEDDEWDSAFPLQRTTRIPSPELIDELIRELSNPDPKKRRRAIWKLAQNADSRAMKPLVELMIDTDSYERNLILEALSQISARTIKPMNQALALSLQDKNPQVRKNAIRDLTRLYDMMSQVSQLLCHAIDDNDVEVQETAKWALNQLNLQMPPRLDLLLNKDNESFNRSGMEEDAYVDSAEADML